MILYQKKINKNVNHIYNTVSIEEWKSTVEENYCFYYNWNDQIYGIEFKDCLSHCHIEFLKSNPKIKVVYDFSGEPIVGSIIDDIVFIFNQWSLTPSQLVVIVSNRLQKEFIEQRFDNFKISILEYNHDIANLSIVKDNRTIPNKKFSVLCRLHRPWRSYLLCRLKEQCLLDNFHYSFIGCENDMSDVVDKAMNENIDITSVLTTGNWKTPIVKDKIKQDLSTICDYRIPWAVKRFINECPHYIEKENFKSDVELPAEILASDIHLIIENGFFDIEESKYTTRSVELGEKTWKAIVTSKPFLVYSDYGYLKDLKNLGFKTFSPLINESYDNEINPKIRAEMIIKEIKKINALSETDYKNLLENCKHITEHNYNLNHSIKDNNTNFLEIDFNNI